jgi:hypothetical protein
MWEDNINMGVQKVGLEAMSWIHLSFFKYGSDP